MAICEWCEQETSNRNGGSGFAARRTRTIGTTTRRASLYERLAKTNERQGSKVLMATDRTSR